MLHKCCCSWRSCPGPCPNPAWRYLEVRGENLLDCSHMLAQLHDPGWSSSQDVPSEVTTKQSCLEAEKVCWPCKACGQRGEWSGKVEWNGQRPGGERSSVSLECKGWGVEGRRQQAQSWDPITKDPVNQVPNLNFKSNWEPLKGFSQLDDVGRSVL